jgi:general secretion pathway protein I
MTDRSQRGFTLVEVLVALVVVAIGLSALMMAVSGTARTSGYLRDKTLAQWIALNRLTEVRLTVNKVAQNATTVGGSAGAAGSSSSSGDTGELKFANRTWHYDTRYFQTTFQSTKRIVVRVWAGDAKTRGNPIAEATGFYGTALSIPGNSNALDWTAGTTAAPCQAPGSQGSGSAGAAFNGPANTPANGMANCTPAATNGVATPGTAVQ